MKKLLSLSVSLVFAFGMFSVAQAQLNNQYPACQGFADAYDTCDNKCSNASGLNINDCDCSDKLAAFSNCQTDEFNKPADPATDTAGSGSSSAGNSGASTGNAPSAPPTTSGTNAGAKYAAQYQGPVFDGPGLRGGANQVAGQLDNGVSKERNLKRLIISWTNFLLSIAAIMAVVALVWAGFLYITAFGDDSRMETAKKIVIWVVLGILLILAAYAIVNTVMRAVF